MTRPLSVQDVTLHYPLSRQQIHAGITSGQLPAVDVSAPKSQRRAWRMTADAVEAYLATLTGKPAA